MARADIRARECWRVRIAAHRIDRPNGAGAYVVSSSDVMRFESERVDAIRAAVRAAHIDAGIPPWKPYLRQSVAYVTAERDVWTPGGR